MKHVRMTTCCLAAAICMGSAATAWADFVNDPPFDPQRTLGWHFDSADWQEPFVYAGPSWGSMGDQDWAGTDPIDAWEWRETDPSWPDHTGLLVLENPEAMQPIVVKLIFRLDNFPDPQDFKWVWDEAEYFFFNPRGGMANIDFEILGPGGVPFANQQILNQVPLPGGGFRDNATGVFNPNPAFEEFVWTLTMPPGSIFILDSYQIATLCIPAPGSVCLLALGVLCCQRRR